MSSDATAVLQSGQPSGKKNAAFWKIFLAILLILIGLGLFLLMLLAFFGSVSGKEFSALSWSTRTFSFTREPITGLQVTGIYHEVDYKLNPIIAPHIAGGSLAPQLDRWDLVSLYRGSAFTTGNAQVLLDYLEATDIDSQPYWATWTSDHPQAAPILWAAVRDCVHLPRYDRLPDLFETARVETDPVKLRAALNTIMVQVTIDEARAKTAAGQPEAAVRAAKLGLLYDPNSKELQQLLGPST